MTLGEAVTGLGYATGAAVFLWQAPRSGVRGREAVILAAVGIGSGLIAARVAEALFSGNVAAVWSWTSGGRAVLPGVLVGWAAVETAKAALGLRASTGDAFALALAAGEAVGRVGCFLNPCCIGSPSDLPWAVYQAGAWRHPAQLYSALAAGATFSALWWLRRNGPIWTGMLFPTYLCLWGSLRFALEFFRDRPLVLGGLSAMQWVALEVAVTSAVFTAVRLHRRRAALRS